MNKLLKRITLLGLVLCMAFGVGAVAAACGPTEQEETYTVSTEFDATKGTVAVSSPADGTAYKKDEQVTVTVTANTGYEVDAFTVNGTAQTLTEGQYTFAIQSNTTVTATFKDAVATPTMFHVTATYTSSQGTVTLSPAAADGNYAENTEITVTVTAATGYVVQSVLLGTEAKTLTDGKFTFTVTADVEITVTFVSAAPTLGFTADYVGTWKSVDGEKIVIAEDSFVLTGASGTEIASTVTKSGDVFTAKIENSDYTVSVSKGVLALQGTAGVRNVYVKDPFPTDVTKPTLPDTLDATYENTADEVAEGDEELVIADGGVTWGEHEVVVLADVTSYLVTEGADVPEGTAIYIVTLDDELNFLMVIPSDGMGTMLGIGTSNGEPEYQFAARAAAGTHTYPWQGAGTEETPFTLTSLVGDYEVWLQRGVHEVDKADGSGKVEEEYWVPLYFTFTLAEETTVRVTADSATSSLPYLLFVKQGETTPEWVFYKELQSSVDIHTFPAGTYTMTVNVTPVDDTNVVVGSAERHYAFTIGVPTYTLTTTVGAGGTIAFSPAAEGNKYAHGTQVTATITPATDYVFRSLQVNMQTVAEDQYTVSTEGVVTYTFTVTGDMNFKPVFITKAEADAEAVCTLTIVLPTTLFNTTPYTVTVDGTTTTDLTKIAKGSTVAIRFSAKTYVVLDSVKSYVGADTEGTVLTPDARKTCTFTITDTTRVEVTAHQQYTVAGSSQNGTYTKVPNQTVYEVGDMVTLTFTPKEHYKFPATFSYRVGVATAETLPVETNADKGVTYDAAAKTLTIVFTVPADLTSYAAGSFTVNFVMDVVENPTFSANFQGTWHAVDLSYQALTIDANSIAWPSQTFGVIAQETDTYTVMWGSKLYTLSYDESLKMLKMVPTDSETPVYYFYDEENVVATPTIPEAASGEMATVYIAEELQNLVLRSDSKIMYNGKEVVVLEVGGSAPTSYTYKFGVNKGNISNVNIAFYTLTLTQSEETYTVSLNDGTDHTYTATTLKVDPDWANTYQKAPGSGSDVDYGDLTIAEDGAISATNVTIVVIGTNSYGDYLVLIKKADGTIVSGTLENKQVGPSSWALVMTVDGDTDTFQPKDAPAPSLLDAGFVAGTYTADKQDDFVITEEGGVVWGSRTVTVVGLEDGYANLTIEGTSCQLYPMELSAGPGGMPSMGPLKISLVEPDEVDDSINHVFTLKGLPSAILSASGGYKVVSEDEETILGGLMIAADSTIIYKNETATIVYMGVQPGEHGVTMIQIVFTTDSLEEPVTLMAMLSEDDVQLGVVLSDETSATLEPLDMNDYLTANITYKSADEVPVTFTISDEGLTCSLDDTLMPVSFDVTAENQLVLIFTNAAKDKTYTLTTTSKTSFTLAENWEEGKTYTLTAEAAGTSPLAKYKGTYMSQTDGSVLVIDEHGTITITTSMQEQQAGNTVTVTVSDEAPVKGSESDVGMTNIFFSVKINYQSKDYWLIIQYVQADEGDGMVQGILMCNYKSTDEGGFDAPTSGEAYGDIMENHLADVVGMYSPGGMGGGVGGLM